MKLSDVKGLGSVKQKLLEKMQIFSVRDLVNLFPRSYTDLNKLDNISSDSTGTIIAQAIMVTDVENKVSSKNKRYSVAYFSSNGLIFQIFWFNNPYIKNMLKIGETYVCFGKMNNEFGKITMFNPLLENIKNIKKLQGLLPDYPLTEGLKQNDLRNILTNALDIYTPESVIPSFIETQFGLVPLDRAYRLIHNPQNYGELELAKQRIAIEEVVQLSFALKFSGNNRNSIRTNKYIDNSEKMNELILSLPFKLTEGQTAAANSLKEGFLSNKNVNALLQGDVGSGKTIIAFLAMYNAFLSGYQSALMVPTEILAKQHYEKAKTVFERFGVKIGFVSGTTTAKQKQEIKEQIENGTLDFIIGTHSLIMNGIKFNRLSLVITDEQHRFSVAQREALYSNNCDSIVMSATPIPRTLALVIYGDMQIIELKDKPKNRLPVKTGIVSERKMQPMYEFLKSEISKGNQIYFVCAKIDDAEDTNLLSVEKLYDELKQKYLKDYRIAYLHGDMKKEEKNEIMQSFNDKKYDCVVATTVIEVGVDVKDATVIVIFDADRFGLTQLHQLRGRVGRSDKQSYCFLVTQTKNENSLKRLEIFVKTHDGFDIANRDFNLRGAGDMLGEAQHGFVNPVFRRLTVDGSVLQKSVELKEVLSKIENYEKYFYLHVNEIYKNSLKITL